MNSRIVALLPLGLCVLHGCSQQVPSVAQLPPQPLPAGWSCAVGLTTTRSNGATAIYTGGDPQDLGYCLGTLNGSPNDGYLGFWPESHGNAEIRAALAKLVAGPAGTTVQFTGMQGEPWTVGVLDRDNYVLNGKQYPAIHISYSSPRVGQNEVRMDAHSGMFFRTQGHLANWHITSISPS